MKFISFFSIIFLFCYALIAQPLTQTIKGRVVDAESGLAVIGANVAILNLSPQKGSSTDAQGYFKIQQVPVGRYTIKITSLGYEDATIQELSVGSGKEIDLTIKLTESLHQLAEVTIKAQKQFGEALNDMASISARSFTVEQTKRYAQDAKPAAHERRQRHPQRTRQPDQAGRVGTLERARGAVVSGNLDTTGQRTNRATMAIADLLVRASRAASGGRNRARQGVAGGRTALPQEP